MDVSERRRLVEETVVAAQAMLDAALELYAALKEEETVAEQGRHLKATS